MPISKATLKEMKKYNFHTISENDTEGKMCATCRHKAKMLTDKKPCKDCDNGCNWEK